jgi:ArsR family metal-binding transcriptional regulator
MNISDLLEQPCNKSDNINKVGSTTCNNLVDIIRLVARLFQQVQYSHEKRSIAKIKRSIPRCIRTACHKLSTGLEQLVGKL